MVAEQEVIGNGMRRGRPRTKGGADNRQNSADDDRDRKEPRTRSDSREGGRALFAGGVFTFGALECGDRAGYWQG